jgi:hypothetical protein
MMTVSYRVTSSIILFFSFFFFFLHFSSFFDFLYFFYFFYTSLAYFPFSLALSIMLSLSLSYSMSLFLTLSLSFLSLFLSITLNPYFISGSFIDISYVFLCSFLHLYLISLIFQQYPSIYISHE